MEFNSQKLQRSMRLSLAYLIIFWVTRYFQMREPAWCFITAGVILFEYSTVGGALSKSYLRMMATLSAAIYSILIIYFFANNPLVNIFALIMGSFLYAYFFMGGSSSYIGQLGSLTLSIMLINYNSLDLTVLRPFNIFIGIIIAMGVMLLFKPQYARDLVIDSQESMLLQLINILDSFLDKAQSVSTVKNNFLIYENQFIIEITNLRRFNDEARSETRNAPSFVSENMKFLGYMKRIYHLVSVLVFHLATNELRANITISNNVAEVRDYLNALRSKLLDVGPTTQKKLAPVALGKIHKSSLKKDNPAVFLDIMFIELSRELSLLNRIIDKISLIRLHQYRSPKGFYAT